MAARRRLGQPEQGEGAHTDPLSTARESARNTTHRVASLILISHPPRRKGIAVLSGTQASKEEGKDQQGLARDGNQERPLQQSAIRASFLASVRLGFGPPV